MVPARGSAPVETTAQARHDADRLLAGYRAARPQEALFDVRARPETGYDEFVDEAGTIRPAWTELADAVGERGRAGLDKLRATGRGLVENDGITYVQIDPNGDAVTNGHGATSAGPSRLGGPPVLACGAAG